jgi:16S rRNA (uracil1498-N3)-methyltransferase
METFYVPGARVGAEEILVDGDEGKHLTQVLRMRPGERARIVDGKGNAFEATIRETGKGTALCAVDGHRLNAGELPVPVLLAAGLLKNPSRFDYLIEKSVELGARTIMPLITARTIARADKKTRWEKIAVAAMKQCGRSILPAILDPVTFEAFLKQPRPDHLLLIPHETSSAPFPRIPQAAGVVLAVGPEGGFTEVEIEAARACGYQAVSLGNRRLRAETAAAAALTLAAAGY